MESRNHVLKTLSERDCALIAPALEEIDLPLRKQLEFDNKPATHFYFPYDSIISVVANGPQRHTIEVGIIGSEGMTGHSLILNAERSPNSVYVQGPGKGARIEAKKFVDALGKSETLRTMALRFVHCFSTQAAQTALANGQAKIDARLARWLLMAHDRTDGNELHLTHQFLATMLGVRRSGVTVVLARFLHEGLIEVSRGIIVVKNRRALREKAKSIYGVTEAELTRLTGWRPKHAPR